MAQPMTSSTGQRANRRSRSAARRELVWTVNPGHPITSRLPPVFDDQRQPLKLRGQGLSPSAQVSTADAPAACCACEGQDPEKADKETKN
jgi:hypothetical protein